MLTTPSKRAQFLAKNKNHLNYIRKATEIIETVRYKHGGDVARAEEIIFNKSSGYPPKGSKPTLSATPKKSTPSASKNKPIYSVSFPQTSQFGLKTASLGSSKPKTQNKPVYPKLINWQQVNLSRLEVGELGEALVLQHEQRRLKELGLDQLADKVEHSSKTVGDGLGYDIKSFNYRGELIYIEVKTTTGGFWSNLIFTRNELEFMQQNSSDYHLYRVYHLNQRAESGELYVVRGNEMEDHFNFAPQSFVAKPKVSD